MEYAVVKNCDLQKFANEVRGLISEGYAPLGGVSIAMESLLYSKGNRIWYCQALTREAQPSAGEPK